MKTEALNLSELEDIVGHRFLRPDILEQALTHSSFARETESQAAASGSAVTADNEQLEFLGDSVLSFVVSQQLFRQFPEFAEGDLSKMRAHIVSARALARPARQLRIGEFLRLGKGEEKSGGRSKSALQVNALEAVIAALYLDGGLEAAHRFILATILQPALKEYPKTADGAMPVSDYKSALQEIVHVAGRNQPRYELVEERGPDHRKVFTVEVHVPSDATGEGAFVRRAQGNTKKRAEQGAARQAWEHLQLLRREISAQQESSRSEPSKQYE
jgi:ribonuclease III